ncbi:hypothetical protein F5876DRAFT_67738 [Lentinula aff. lateritia]|uniref:Uncharacterized protein n=1 Tax=Lentinula aff. lateritia TaxID=2804960 RepID=A0ACC1TTD4_9AGAR|nr:hypothetical protein F5876DRAFT_67738 [Lentinula aff. lateritia]
MPRVTSFKFIDESARECRECSLVFDYPYQMRKHMQTHGHADASQAKFRCTWDGCAYSSSQRSNFNTHYRTHTQEKSKACPDCSFRTGDPSSLTRHRKRIHNYVPNPRKARRSSSDKLVIPASATVSFQSTVDFASVPTLSSGSLPTSNSGATASGFSPLSLDFEMDPSFDAIGLDYSCNQAADTLPLSLGNLFNQPPAFQRFDAFGLTDCPRPLFPAVDSTSSLERSSNNNLQFRSESWSDLSLLFGNNTMPSLERISSSDMTHVSEFSFFASPYDNTWQTNAGVSNFESYNQCPEVPVQHLQPEHMSYESCAGMDYVTGLDPSTSVVISPEDLEVIFGSKTHDQHNEQDAGFPEVSPCFNLPSYDSPVISQNQTLPSESLESIDIQTLPLEFFEQFPSTSFPSLSSSSTDPLFDLDQFAASLAC